MKKNIKILLIEDDEDDFFIIKEFLIKNSNYEWEIFWKTNIQELFTSTEINYDLCLTDYYLGKDSALDVISLVKKEQINLPIIVLTGSNNREKDIEVMKAGAIDYLVKEKINSENLERSIRYAINRNNTEILLKVEKDKFQKLFDFNTSSIIILDCSFHIIDFNLEAKKFLKVKVKDSSYLNINDLFISPNFIQLIKEGSISKRELEIKTNDNREVSCLVSIIEIFNSNKTLDCYQLIITDMTDLVQANTKIKNIEKINFSGKMARTLAHEIRNPLSNINLSASFLKDDLKSADGVKYLDLISKSSNRVNNIVTDFLNNTKEVNLNKTLFFIEDLMKETIKLSEDKISLNNIIFELDYNENLALRINGDIDQLSIALSNIILNGIDAVKNKKNPSIKVEVKNKDKKLVIIISDNGIGMDSEELECLFEPFKTSKKSGVGIGLSSVYNILSLHKAGIKVNSAVNEGTSFYITLDTVG